MMFTKEQLKEMRLKLIEASTLLSEVAHILLNIEEPKCPLCSSFTCKHDTRMKLVPINNGEINISANTIPQAYTPASKNTGNPLEELQRNLRNLSGQQTLDLIQKLQEKK